MKNKELGLIGEGSFQEDDTPKGDIQEEKEDEGTTVQLNVQNYVARNNAHTMSGSRSWHKCNGKVQT